MKRGRCWSCVKRGSGKMKRIRWWVCIMVLVFDGSIYVYVMFKVTSCIYVTSFAAFSVMVLFLLFLLQFCFHFHYFFFLYQSVR